MVASELTFCWDRGQCSAHIYSVLQIFFKSKSTASSCWVLSISSNGDPQPGTCLSTCPILTSTRANHFMAPQSRWPYAERAWAPPGFPSCKSYRHQSMKHCHIYSQQLVPHDEGSCNYKELPCKKIADVIRDNNEYKVE